MFRWVLVVAILIIGSVVGINNAWQSYVAAPNSAIKAPSRGVRVTREGDRWKIQATDSRRKRLVGRPFYTKDRPVTTSISPKGMITVISSSGKRESHSFWGDNQPDHPVDNQINVAAN